MSGKLVTTAVDVAAAAGPGIGAGIGALGGLRFLRWSIEFVYRRLDVRHERLTTKEAELEKRYDARLAHLEQELRQTRKAMMLLINHVARNDPTARVLVEVAELLDEERLPPTRDATLDKLMKKAGEALDGR